MIMMGDTQAMLSPHPALYYIKLLQSSRLWPTATTTHYSKVTIAGCLLLLKCCMNLRVILILYVPDLNAFLPRTFSVINIVSLPLPLPFPTPTLKLAVDKNRVRGSQVIGLVIGGVSTISCGWSLQIRVFSETCGQLSSERPAAGVQIASTRAVSEYLGVVRNLASCSCP